MIYSCQQNYDEVKNVFLEAPGIDPGTSRMLSERSTIWATPPFLFYELKMSALKFKDKNISSISTSDWVWFLAHKNNDKLFRVFLVFLFHVSIHRNIGMYLFLQENIYVTKWRKKSLFSAVLSIILLYTFCFFSVHHFLIFDHQNSAVCPK